MKQIAVPELRDPRWMVVACLLSYVLVLIGDPGFGKNYWQLATAICVTVGLDFFVSFFIKKRPHFPLSALSTSIGTTLIIFSPYIWPFAVIPLFAAASKFFLRHKGLHIFNPNNCGMVLAFLFLNDSVSTTYGRWTELPMLFIAIIVYGILLSFRVKRLDMSVSYIGSYVIFALLRGEYSGISPTQVLLPMANAIFYIFAFYHMTDPVTTPKNRKGRILFAVLIGLIDNGLRFYEIQYSPFYALFAMAAMQPLFENIFRRDSQREFWRIAYKQERSSFVR